MAKGGTADSGQKPRLAPQTYAAVPAQAMQDSRLKASDFRVLSAISWRADATGIAWPSQQDIANVTGLSRPTVGTCVSRLAKYGYLKRVPMTRRGGRWPTNSYQLVREKPAENPLTTDPPCKDSGDTDRVVTVATSPCRDCGDTNRPMNRVSPEQARNASKVELC